MRIAFNRIFFLLFGSLFLLADLSAQPTLPSDLKKPKKYEERKLGAEKTEEKKFKLPRRVIQNTVTHYNWFFNANQRLNQVLDRAKQAHRDDFTQLLPFYNYSLEVTARDSAELDSVIYKANAGILIHDLRNAWIDNLFMLMGKAYFFRDQLDSAYMTFQYINYAYSPKDADGYDIPIGSNATEGGSALSISTKETNSLVKKAFSTPPSRNESFLWQVRTWLENDRAEEASSLLQALRNDALFPARLQPDLNELQALYFYNRQIPDSAAYYLSNALSNATNRYELSRWEYLIGQLYEKAGKPELASEYFGRSVKHTLDPVMEVYGRLNLIRQNKGDSLVAQKNIDELVRMGRKDRYTKYRDIIYFTAAQMELERNHIDAARKLLLLATRWADPNAVSSQRSLAWLTLGDLAFQQKEYRDAKSFYDSLGGGDPVIKDPVAFTNRTAALAEIVAQMDVLHRQDSLQQLASLPVEQRDAIIKKKLKELRKLQGLKEEENQPTPNAQVPFNANQNNAPTDLFGGDNAKGEWYFNNPALKSKGYNAFKVKGGNRPNVDNWRRLAAASEVKSELEENQPVPTGQDSAANLVTDELSFDNLLKQLPLTDAQKARSRDSVENAKVSEAKALFNGLEDYAGVIALLQDFPKEYPEAARLPEALYYLNYAYRRTGNTARADEMMQMLQEKFAGNPFERQVSQAKNGISDSDPKVDMDRRYNQIYNNFIEGKFEEAIQQKQEADNLYGSNYWTPQLLYIESIYYIRQRRDEEAKTELSQIVDLYPGTPMAEKAANLIDVVNRRKEIEDYLTSLQIERPREDSVVITEVPPTQPAKTQPPAAAQDSTRQEPVVTEPEVAPADTVAAKPVEPKKKEGQVTPVQPKKEGPVQPPVVKRDSVQGKPVIKTFNYNPDEPYQVMIVLNNVDPVYVTETRNAFNRYNQQRFAGQPITINNVVLSDSVKLVVMTGFANAAAALSYSDEVKQTAPTSIVPWLPAGKYQFMIISRPNLESLLQNRDLGEYRKFLLRTWPDNFK